MKSTTTGNETRERLFAVLFLALLAAAFLIYLPGLNGPLVLDDIPNLKRLSYVEGVNDWSSFFRFILSGSGVYPARPLSFASFLINDTGWPLTVSAQKYTNVLIHLINGALVFWLGLLLGRLTGLAERTVVSVGLVAAALWLLAPLQVSTVLYLVQRMTELSAMFVLSGLIAYCYARERLNIRPVSAHVWMTAAVGVFGTLGFLCKENAILLPLYILAVERTLLRANLPVMDPKVRLWFSTWRWLVLVAPVVAAFLALGLVRDIFGGYDFRPFTAFERIASQPRILFDYLQNLLIPIRHGMGIAHDDYPLSTGLWTPPSTLIAIVALAGLAAGAWYLSRRTASLFSFAVLWFLAGHVLESSIIALEPYFEHRNYLPAFGPFFALACAAWTTRVSVRGYLKLALVLYIACFAFVARQNVDIWSNKLLMADTLAREHPRSVRAQQMRADVWAVLGHDDTTDEILHRIADMRPGAMSPQLQLLLSRCRTHPDNIERYLREVRKRVEEAYFDHAVIPTLITLAKTHEEKCPGLTATNLLDLIDFLLEQESVRIRSGAVSDLLYVKATILARENRIQSAASHLYAAFHRRSTYDIGLNAVEYLYESKQYRAAMSALNEVEDIRLKRFSPDRFRQGELDQWRSRIQEALGHGN